MLYSTFDWDVNAIVPVGTPHVGWITVDVLGVLGAPGAALTDKSTLLETQLLSEILLTVTGYKPALNPPNVVLVWYAVPSILYS